MKIREDRRFDLAMPDIAMVEIGYVIKADHEKLNEQARQGEAAA